MAETKTRINFSGVSSFDPLDAGEYLVSVSTVKITKNKKTNAPQLMVIFDVDRDEHPEVGARKTTKYFTLDSSDEYFWVTKKFIIDGGVDEDELGEDCVIEEHISTLEAAQFRIDVTESTGKDGKTYVNVGRCTPVTPY